MFIMTLCKLLEHPEKQILIEPVFAQWIQAAHGKTLYGFDFLLSSS